jgi:hypothetical protein
MPATALAIPTSEVENMEFHIGDKVRVGSHVGAVTDVGTVLIQVQTTEGGFRVVCPWELVKTRDGDNSQTQVAYGCKSEHQRSKTNDQHPRWPHAKSHVQLRD